jgi:hypothetical protein
MHGSSVRPKCDVYIDILYTVGLTTWYIFVPLPLAFIPTPALTRLRRRGDKNCWPGT